MMLEMSLEGECSASAFCRVCSFSSTIACSYANITTFSIHVKYGVNLLIIILNF